MDLEGEFVKLNELGGNKVSRKLKLGVLILSLGLSMLTACNDDKSSIQESSETTKASADTVVDTIEDESGNFGSLPLTVTDRVDYNSVNGENQNNLVKAAAKEISKGYFRVDNSEAAEYLMVESNKEVPYVKVSFDITNNSEKQIQLYLAHTNLILEDGEQILCNDSISGIGDNQGGSTTIAPSATVKDVNAVFIPSKNIENLENASLYISTLCDAEGYYIDDSDLKIDIYAVE
jgi:hypothetical protein